MANPKLTTRMRRFFERQHATYERMLSNQDALQTELRDEHLDHYAERQKQHAKDTTSLEREFRLLMRDWSAADDLDEAEHAEVEAHLQRAKELAKELVKRNDAAANEIRNRMKLLKSQTMQLRRGRASLRKYRPGGSAQPGFIDRKT